MTPAELEQIRARCAPGHDLMSEAEFTCPLDRQNLLAEVDRLRGILAQIGAGIAATARYDHSQCLMALAAIEQLAVPAPAQAQPERSGP